MYTSNSKQQIEKNAGKKICFAEIVISVFDRIENIVGKGKNPGCQ